MQEASTRERLLTEAMRLFGEHGYQATSVAKIEAAAGLAPGSGALYNHFKSKEALLDAGIDRQLDRRHAMRDIRSLFAGLGDLRIELTMLGRYVLTVLDEETQLLKIASRIPSGGSKGLQDAHTALFDGLNAEMVDWLQGWAPGISKQQAESIGAVAFNSLVGKHVKNTLFHAATADIPDERYIADWTAMLANQIESFP